MPTVFVIADEWRLRAGVRAELRERGVNALGFAAAEDIGRSLVAGEAPAAIVLDANSKAAPDPAVQQLIKRIPTILIASRTAPYEAVPGVTVLFRPVPISEVVRVVLELAKGPSV